MTRVPPKKRAKKDKKSVALAKTKAALLNHPLFISPDGEVTADPANGQVLSYHVSRKMILGSAKSFMSDPKLVISEDDPS